MPTDPFSSSDIQDHITERGYRLHSRWLDMEPRSEFPAGLDEELIGILVETLDGYAECCLEGVSDRTTLRLYGVLLHNRWAAILAAQEKEGPLAPFESRGFRPMPNLQNPQNADPFSATRHEAWRNSILDAATARIEARYAHWQAEALKRLRGLRQTRPGAAGDSFPGRAGPRQQTQAGMNRPARKWTWRP